MSAVVMFGAAAEMRAFISANAVEPAANATIYSAGVGSFGVCARACAHNGVTGVDASTVGVSTFSISGFSSWGSVLSWPSSGSSCSLLLPACAAIWWIREVSNAGNGTTDSSSQRLAVTTIVPFSSYVYSVGITPTDTASNTPSIARVKTSLPAGVSLMRAAKYIPAPSPSSTSTRSVTTPIGRAVS